MYALSTHTSVFGFLGRCGIQRSCGFQPRWHGCRFGQFAPRVPLSGHLSRFPGLAMPSAYRPASASTAASSAGRAAALAGQGTDSRGSAIRAATQAASPIRQRRGFPAPCAQAGSFRCGTPGRGFGGWNRHRGRSSNVRAVERGPLQAVRPVRTSRTAKRPGQAPGAAPAPTGAG